jgi:hypothetical protein
MLLEARQTGVLLKNLSLRTLRLAAAFRLDVLLKFTVRSSQTS